MAITLDGTVGVTSPDFIPSSSNIPTNGLFLPAANTVGLATGSTERLRIDSSGNLGLGVTPSAWVSPFTNAFQIGTSGAVATTTTSLRFANNAYYGSLGWTYRATAAAGHYDIIDNTHSWYNAPSGTAGAAISFTQAMTLDASGNLLVGGTSQNGTANRTAVFSTNKFGISVIDTTAQTAGVGGALNLGGNYRSTGDAQAFVRVEAAKENSTDANYAYAMAFSTTPNGGTFTERARIDSSGNLLVGQTTSGPTVTGTSIGSGGYVTSAFNITSSNQAWVLNNNNATGTTYSVEFRQNNVAKGSISVSSTATTYNTLSDQRLKENIVDAPSALGSVNAIKVRSFDWKSDGSHVDYGYIAQELLEIVPEAVTVPEDPEQMMGVDFGKLTPRLVKAIQELTARLEALEAK